MGFNLTFAMVLAVSLGTNLLWVRDQGIVERPLVDGSARLELSNRAGCTEAPGFIQVTKNDARYMPATVELMVVCNLLSYRMSSSRECPRHQLISGQSRKGVS